MSPKHLWSRSTRAGHGTLTVLAVLILFILSALISSSGSSAQFPGIWPSSVHDLSLRPPSGGDPVYKRANLSSAQIKRYSHLKKPRIPGPENAVRIGGAQGKGKYMFVTLTRNIEDQLPDLINAFTVLVSFLGAEHVRFSFLEGPSSDRTASILRNDFIPVLRYFGVPDDQIVIKTDSPAIDWNQHHRIEKLAELRNEAMEPLWKRAWEDTVAVVFFNDVYLRARDVLELLHQHVQAGEKEGNEVGATSAIDWMQKTPEYYYDVWVGKTMQGDIFYPVHNTWWEPSENLLETSPSSRLAYDRLRPFQAFATWGGMIVLAATPFLAPHNVRFRRGDAFKGDKPSKRRKEGSCQASECENLCRDLWEQGWGRIQVVPSVQVAYDRHTVQDIIEKVDKQMHKLGWRNEIPTWSDDVTVSFDPKPPASVVCYDWPEKHGLDGNIWELKSWGPPWPGHVP